MVRFIIDPIKIENTKDHISYIAFLFQYEGKGFIGKYNLKK